MNAITVPASIDRLQQVLAQIGSFLEREGCPENERRLIEISAEELFTNIVTYAYAPNFCTGAADSEAADRGKIGGETVHTGKNGQVKVEYDVCTSQKGGKRVSICFKDQGTPFNPFAREDPDLTLPIEDRPIGGLGIYMVKQFMDGAEYRYDRGWNILTISKDFGPDEAED